MQFILFASLLASSVNALPLNINLGAYSPALVVGDGEISFGGKQDVSNLMNALEGAAVSGAAANGQAAPAPAAAAVVPAVSAAAVATPESAAIITTDQSPQITALQGMGKEIAPRVVKLEREQRTSEKRDITGFNAALKYASEAIKTTPKIELGTENSGVGILQSAGINAAQPAAAPAAAPAAEAVVAKRDTPRMKTTVTTMFVRGGPSPAQDSASKARSLEGSAVEKRAPSPGLDGVNLNMAEGQVAELTFVETREAGEDDE